MLERIVDLPPAIDGLRATGRVSKEDYEHVFTPLLEQARSSGRRLRLLYHFGPEFDSFTPGAAWEDMQVGMRHLRLFERCAIVTDKDWLRGAARAAGMMMPCPLKVFRDAEWNAAVAWLDSPAAGVHVEHRLLPDRSVLLVEPRGRLSVEDFDAIALTVDPWLESGNELHGLVVHAREFPGWETIGSFLRHVQFVRDHHRKVQRVALSADGKLAKLAPAIVESFVGAEIQHFGFDELDRALDWASRPHLPATASA